ncbi:ribonuclease E inhibitor RraB [Pseudoduganella sp. FT55W]|uniref:Ribonuclease E inhibitor RraB n=1 Tax=Duganella rivi TaxID=2666083 RepID=A0A7X4GS62_9BURK|nr:ribonuclease E inhibitor RraB [Duganella rivi]MYM68697.1 ribonuclease E inhibitor RraB [Duganella rivi]
MITLHQLDEFFENTRQMFDTGRCLFRIDDECRWSYFFVDPDREKLLPIADYMKGLGYEFMGTLDPNEDDDDPVYYLRIDKVQRHSPASLNELNRQLYGIADQFGVHSYDGMDVGAIDGP